MRTLTKKQMKDLGESQAGRHRGTFELSFDQVEAIGSYDDRRAAAKVAAEAAYEALDGQLTGVKANPEFKGEFVWAYADKVLSQWGAVIQQRMRARQNFANHLSRGITYERAKEQAVKMVTERFSHYGIKVQSSYNVTVEFPRLDGWGSEPTVYLRDERTDLGSAIKDPDNAERWLWPILFRVEISWTGTTRSLSESVHMIAQYQHAIEVAAALEQFMARLHVISKSWSDEPEVTPEEKEQANLAAIATLIGKDEVTQ